MMPVFASAKDHSRFSYPYARPSSIFIWKLLALPPEAIVTVPDGEKGAAVYLVADFAAECRGDRRDDAARGEITDQCRMPERSVGEDAERGDSGRTHDRRYPANAKRLTNTR